MSILIGSRKKLPSKERQVRKQKGGNGESREHDGSFPQIEPFEPLAVLRAKALEYAEGTRLDIKEKVEGWYTQGKGRSWKRVLALIGPAGYGKSVIMAYLGLEGGLVSREIQKGSKKSVKWFRTLKRALRRKTGKSSPKEVRISLHRRNVSETPNFTVGAAHFFKHDDSNAASVRLCFLSIANQLAVIVPGVKEELLKLNKEEIESITDLKVLFRSLLCTPMMRVKAPEHPIVVLLDALDEANVEEKEELVEILATMWESETPQWLGVIVSSRPEALVKNKFGNPHMLQLDSEENVEGLNKFLRQRLERYMKAQEDIDKAVKIMASRCDGLFLFAGFVDTMLQERKERSISLGDIKTLTKAFPQGLESVYRTYFTRFLQGPLESNYEQYQVLLSSMVAARSPLDVDIVAALLELRNQDAMEAFTACLEHLLVVEEGRFRFVHESMREFVQDKKRAGKVGEDGGKHLSVSMDMGHKQLVNVLKAKPASRFTLEHLVYHLCKSKNWEGVRGRLLNFDWVHAAVSQPGVAKRLIDDTDMLYNYQSFSDINVTDVIRAIELGRSVIEGDPNSLAFQLLGRIADRSHPMLESFHASEFAKSNLATSVYVPIRASLEPARSPLRKILDGHSGTVTTVAIDGDTVVSGSEDTTVRLWDRRTGKCLHVLEEHSGYVNSVAIDGDTVVSGSEDTTVRLWDRRTGECLQVLEGHRSSVYAVAIDKDTVVSDSGDWTVRLWDRRSGEGLYVLKGHSSWVNSVAVDGATVVSGSEDKTVRLWDRQFGECLQVLVGHYDAVTAVAVAGDTVVSGSGDKTVRLWDRQSGECLQVLEGQSFNRSAVAIDGDTVVTCSRLAVESWDRMTGECLQVLKGYSDEVTAVAIDGDTIVSSSSTKTVRLWDRRGGQVRYSLKGYSPPVSSAAIDGDIVVSVSHDQTVRLWDMRTGECLQVLEGHSCSVNAIAIDKDTVVSGSWDQTVRLWDRQSGECLQVLVGHSHAVNEVAIDGDTVVSVSHDQTVRLWDRRTGECLQVLEGHSCIVSVVTIAGDTVVSGSRDQTVRLWNRWSGECLQVLKGHSCSVNAVAIYKDTVVSGSADKTVRLWDRVSGKCLQVLVGHSDSVYAVAIEGDTVVSGSGDKTVRLWARRSGENMQVLEGSPAGGLDAIADIATPGSQDATVHLASCVLATFDRFVTGVALCNIKGDRFIVVSEGSSSVPHVLVPLSTVLRVWEAL